MSNCVKLPLTKFITKYYKSTENFKLKLPECKLHVWFLCVELFCAFLYPFWCFSAYSNKNSVNLRIERHDYYGKIH